MRAVSYLRFSHDKQSKGFSIEEQQSACQQKAKVEHYEIVNEFIDKAQSAKTMNRPALVEALSFVCDKKNNIDALYIFDTSRLSRDSMDFAIIKKKLSEKGVLVKVVMGVSNDSLEGDLVQDLLARVVQYDNQMKSVKTKGGMHSRFLAGYALHTVRGYKWSKNTEGKAIIVPDETFPIYQALWHKIRDEKLSIVNAVKYFNKLSSNTKLTKSALSRMLENKLYYGVLSYPKYPEEVQGQHEPMIDEDTFWQVRSIITGRSHKNTKTRNKVNPLYPLTKSLLCPHCDMKLTAAKSKGKLKHYEYYFCRDRSGCKYNQQVADVHKAFVKKLEELIPTDEMMQFIKEMIIEKYEAHFNDLQLSSRDVEKELADFETKKGVLLDKLLEGTITNDVYKTAEIKLDAEIIARKTLLSEKKLDRVEIETVLNWIIFYMKNIHKIWERYSVEVQIALQCSTFPKGVYYENKVCRTPEISFAFKTKEIFAALSAKSGDPSARYVEHLNKIIPAYQELYKTMSPYFVS